MNEFDEWYNKIKNPLWKERVFTNSCKIRWNVSFEL
jgi:hypothetical protein